MMKGFVYVLASAFALLAFAPVSAQFESIEGVEVDLIKSHTDGELAGYNTYRVYAVMENEGDMIMAVYGQDTIPLSITTDGEFFQHHRGGAFSKDVHRYDLRELTEVHPLLAYDSWLTIGYEDHYENGVGGLGLDLRDFEESTNVADSIYTTDGAWYVMPENSLKQVNQQAVAGPSKRILLMQLTTNGNLKGFINVQGSTRIIEVKMEGEGTVHKLRNPIRSTSLRFSAP